MAATGHNHGLRIRIFGDAGSLEWQHEDPHHLVLQDLAGVTRILTHGLTAGEDSGQGGQQNQPRREQGQRRPGHMQVHAPVKALPVDHLDQHQANRATRQQAGQHPNASGQRAFTGRCAEETR